MSLNTKTVIVECAFFQPDAIIGKTVKYDIQSEAAYKFERGVDYSCHEMVLRRFAKIVNQHTSIKRIEYFTKSYSDFNENFIDINTDKINSTLVPKLAIQNVTNFFQILDLNLKIV